MPRIAVPVTKVSRLVANSLAAAINDPVNDMTVPNNGSTLVLIVNTGGTPRTAQAVIEQTVDGEPVDIKDYPIAANAFVVIGPYPRQIYGDNLLVNTDHADLAVRAFSLV